MIQPYPRALQITGMGYLLPACGKPTRLNVEALWPESGSKKVNLISLQVDYFDPQGTYILIVTHRQFQVFDIIRKLR